MEDRRSPCTQAAGRRLRRRRWANGERREVEEFVNVNVNVNEGSAVS